MYNLFIIAYFCLVSKSRVQKHICLVNFIYIPKILKIPQRYKF